MSFMTVIGTSVAVGSGDGTGVSVGFGVSVGGAAVDGTSVAVGGKSVAVGGMGVEGGGKSVGVAVGSACSPVHPAVINTTNIKANTSFNIIWLFTNLKYLE